jgi:flagella basal body P-ring formation protein FlgA
VLVVDKAYAATLAIAIASALALGASSARAAAEIDSLRELMQESAKAISLPGARIEVDIGQADARLRLAPCTRTEPYLPAGLKPLGRTRVGLRCVAGASRWNITMPAVVKIWAPGLVARAALPAGTVLVAEQLVAADVDWAASGGLAFTAPPIGRVLARPLASGAALRSDDLEQHRLFASGERVTVVARGLGYSVSGEGQAMQPGIEGQTVRIRTDAGRVLSGRPIGGRLVEVNL